MNLFELLPAEKQEKLMQSFGRDAQKAISTLREAIQNNDIQSLTSTFHAMKSALANIGQSEKSEMALMFEKAGKNGESDYIIANVDKFIAVLHSFILVEETENMNSVDSADKSISEDFSFVTEQLHIIKSSCDDYNYDSANTHFNALLKKPLKSQTHEFVTKMNDLLYSDSDFDGISEKISDFLNEYKK